MRLQASCPPGLQSSQDSGEAAGCYSKSTHMVFQALAHLLVISQGTPGSQRRISGRREE